MFFCSTCSLRMFKSLRFFLFGLDLHTVHYCLKITNFRGQVEYLWVQLCYRLFLLCSLKLPGGKYGVFCLALSFFQCLLLNLLLLHLATRQVGNDCMLCQDLFDAGATSLTPLCIRLSSVFCLQPILTPKTSIILQLGHYKNNTSGPYFDKGAMGYTNLVHQWPLKREIGSPDVLVEYRWPSRFFLQNLENREFPSLALNFSWSLSNIFKRS